VGDIRFEHVHFAYRPVTDAVLDRGSAENEIKNQTDDARTRSDKHMADASAAPTELTPDVVKSEETCVFTGLSLQLLPGTTTGMCVFFLNLSRFVFRHLVLYILQRSSAEVVAGRVRWLLCCYDSTTPTADVSC
jgi:hypothetical protein